jgi:hypothetical protein
MPRDNAHTVELPTKAVEQLPQQAVDNLPANVPTGPEVHHEEFTLSQTLIFDAETLDFHTGLIEGENPEFAISPTGESAGELAIDICFPS